MAKGRQTSGLVDVLLFTQFADKITIICESEGFSFEKSEFETDLKRIQRLRDQLANANDYAASPKAADNGCRAVGLIDKWNNAFVSLLIRPSWPALRLDECPNDLPFRRPSALPALKRACRKVSG